MADYSYTYHLRKRCSDETLREADRSRVLLKAAAEGQTPRVRHMLGLGADIDHTDDDGFGALHHAVLSGYEDIVKLLLDAGADVNADSLHFGSPLKCNPAVLATLEKRDDLIEILTSRAQQLATTSVSQIEVRQNEQEEVDSHFTFVQDSNNLTSEQSAAERSNVAIRDYQIDSNSQSESDERASLERSRNIPERDFYEDENGQVTSASEPDSHNPMPTKTTQAADSHPRVHQTSTTDVNTDLVQGLAINVTPTCVIANDPNLIKRRASYVITTLCKQAYAMHKYEERHYIATSPCVYIVCGTVPGTVGIFLQSTGTAVPSFRQAHTCGKQEESLAISSMTVCSYMAKYSSSRLARLSLILRAKLGHSKLHFESGCTAMASEKFTKEMAWYRVAPSVAWQVVIFWMTIIAELDRSLYSASEPKWMSKVKEIDVNAARSLLERLPLWRQVFEWKVGDLESNVQKHKHTLLGIKKVFLA